jgi:hypothetical protein
MARSLSDTIIVAMVEAATRLAGARGPIAGSRTQPGGEPVSQPAEGAAPAESAPAGDGKTGAAAAQSTVPAPAASARPLPEDHDARTAEQIGADFKAIYLSIEEVVKASAEQESKAVGFGVR